MALPKEPRQKMINIMYLVLTAILALNVSAEVINAFRTVNKSLRDSNDNIERGNATLFKSFADKMSRPETKDLATLWNDKAQKAKQYSDAMYKSIDDLIMQVKKEAGLRLDANGAPKINSQGNEDYKEDYLEAATRIFEKHDGGKDLYNNLVKYKADMLGIDSSISAAFSANFPVDMTIPKSNSGNSKTGDDIKDWTANYFHMTPAVAAITILSKFQNNIKNAENQIVTFCHSKIGEVVVHMDQAGVLVGQSSNYLMPNDELTITAGVGAYSSTASPTISINGSSVPVTAGQGTYKTTVSGAGEHSVNITVNYKDEKGQIQTKTETVKYTVGTPGGSAVMLDKMNVFYIGVDNPVTIGSPTGWDKTQVSISGAGATMTGSNDHRVVRVTSVGECTINVTANGKSAPFKFRVKRIPDPIIKVGASGGGKMQAAAFRAQQFVSAVLENFDFEAHYSVTGATIYFNNPGDRNVKSITLTSGSLEPARQYMSTLQPGSSVIFDNIRVVGPDGQPRTIQNPPGFSLF